MPAKLFHDPDKEPMPDPERVAYWYFRLNGFLQFENFIVHPGTKGSQRTDADLIGVRFPNRKEFLLDRPDPMKDDVNLGLVTDRTDVVIVEIKKNGPCSLNGPWTDESKQNVDRVLAAIGCLDENKIRTAAKSIYATGMFCEDLLQIRFIAVGREANETLSKRYDHVTQLTWHQMLDFMWHRFDKYPKQKNDVPQWRADGRWLKARADSVSQPGPFIEEILRELGIGLTTG